MISMVTVLVMLNPVIISVVLFENRQRVFPF